MEKEVITIYCIIDDTLKLIGIIDDPQVKMSSSEILTTAVISCIYFGRNFRNALSFMSNYCSYVLHESRFHICHIGRVHYENKVFCVEL